MPENNIGNNQSEDSDAWLGHTRSSKTLGCPGSCRYHSRFQCLNASGFLPQAAVTKNTVRMPPKAGRLTRRGSNSFPVCRNLCYRGWTHCHLPEKVRLYSAHIV